MGTMGTKRFVAVLVVLIFALKEGAAHRAAIVANGLECAAIARKMLDAGGSVADAAIAGLLCEGVASPQSTGLGGGLVLTIYIKESNHVESLIARDVAPLAATEDMFVNTTVTGGKAISVPGELKGYWELHQKYGKLNWSQLFDPVIELCRKGHVVSTYLGDILQNNRNIIRESPTLSKIFIDPMTNDVYRTGDKVKRIELAKTLGVIQKEGVNSMYNNGSIAQMLTEDIQAIGGIVTVEDLMKYKVRWEKPITVALRSNKTMHTMPLPGSGALVTFILNILNGYLPPQENVKSLHRIAEAFKFAYAQRTKLGDVKFVESVAKVVENLTDYQFAMKIRKKLNDYRTYQDVRHYGANFSMGDDHGTSHINIIGPNGDAIAATGSINNIFGCKIVSEQTGIILNDGMDDFGTPGKNNSYGMPPSPANFIKPQKMPLSSMCPTIVLDQNGDVELVLGAAGGSKITSSVAYVLLRYLYFNETVKDAVRAPRIHHQLVPMRLSYETGFLPEIIYRLAMKGHKMFATPSDSGFAALTAIGRNGRQMTPVYDQRRGGSAEVIE